MFRLNAYVPLPSEVWQDAIERAECSDEPERLTAYLLDYIGLEFGFVVDEEVVHTTEGFEPGAVVAPGSPDRPTLTDEQDGTPVTVEVDVPRELWEDTVEETKRMNAIPADEFEFVSPPFWPETKLIDLITLDIRWFVDGEDRTDEAERVLTYEDEI